MNDNQQQNNAQNQGSYESQNTQQYNYGQPYYQSQAYNQPNYQQGYYNSRPNYDVNQMKSNYNYTLLLVLSIIELFFNMVCGILGIVFVSMMSGAIERGDLAKAEKYAKYTKIALIIGGILAMLSFVLSVLAFVFVVPAFINVMNELITNSQELPYYFN